MNNLKNILVTGANGQLGMEFRALSELNNTLHFFFVSKEELSITDSESIEQYFIENNIGYCINCAAYTAVDKAESEKELAFEINGFAVGRLAAICKMHSIGFIHFSTDYVFNGNANKPYLETDHTDPVNLYGASKLLGESEAILQNPQSIIIRTSWVYSNYGKNFVKTMLRLMSEKEEINVVNDQFGSPTYAKDLAMAAIEIIVKNIRAYGIFNFCNRGIISWFDFAEGIKAISGADCTINPVPTSSYHTAAKRPQYSVLDATKIQVTFNCKIAPWKESLRNCLGN